MTFTIELLFWSHKSEQAKQQQPWAVFQALLYKFMSTTSIIEKFFYNKQNQINQTDGCHKQEFQRAILLLLWKFPCVFCFKYQI